MVISIATIDYFCNLKATEKKVLARFGSCCCLLSKLAGTFGMVAQKQTDGTRRGREIRNFPRGKCCQQKCSTINQYDQTEIVSGPRKEYKRYRKQA